MPISESQKILSRIRSMTASGRVPTISMRDTMLAACLELELNLLLQEPVMLTGQDATWEQQGLVLNVGFKVVTRAFTTTTTLMHNLTVTVSSALEPAVTMIWDQQGWSLQHQDASREHINLPTYYLTKEAKGAVYVMDFGYVSAGAYFVRHGFRAQWPEKEPQV